MTTSETANKEAERSVLQFKLKKRRGVYRRGQILWSFCWHVTLFATPLVGFATVVAAATDYSTLFESIGAGLVTALGALAGLGRFHEKWRTARLSRSEIDQLLVDLDDPRADLGSIRQAYKKVIRDQDRAVLGPGRNGPPAE